MFFVHFYLILDGCNARLDDLVTGALEVWRRSIESVRERVYGALLEVRSLRKLQEVETDEVVKMLPHLIIIGEITAII